MTRPSSIVLGVGLAALFGCGGSGTPAATPAAPTAAAPSAPAVPEPAKAPEAPKRVKVETVQVEGGGLAEADVQKALEPVGAEYEKCYAAALESAPDAGGTTWVTLLYVKGQRASVSASYSGPGSDLINKCFQQASEGLKLSPAASAERCVVSVKLTLAK